MKTRWLVLLLLTFGSACHADRDIVYAARYYTPPGSHRTSHFHLYRINPDGTGKTQWTFGKADDDNPKWSPDDKHIVFTRDTGAGNYALCLMAATGGPITNVSSRARGDADNIQWSPDSRLLAVSGGDDEKPEACLISVLTHRVVRGFPGVSDFIWFSDSHHAYLKTKSGDKVLDLRTGAEYPVKNTLNGALKSPIGLGRYVVGYTIDDKSKAYLLRFFNPMGREVKQLKLNFSHSMPSGVNTPYYPYQGDALLTVSSSHIWLIYALHDHSTSGDNWYYSLLNTTDGTMRYLTQGAFLAWSPDGLHFCTAPRKTTISYAKRKEPWEIFNDDTPEGRIEEEYRQVWAAPLYVRATAGGPMRQITPRLSCLAGADWRVGKR